MVDSVRVIIVEDHDMVREGLVAALEATNDIEVLTAVENVGRARGAIESHQPDLVVADYQLPDGNGTELCSMVRSNGEPVKTLLITGVDEYEAIEAAIEAGCVGFVSKARGVAELAEAIRSASRGAAIFPAALYREVLARRIASPQFDLTGRELEVLQMLAEAASAEEIAEQLFLSVHTVRNHIRSLLGKLGARNQLDALVIGVRASLVTIDPA